MRLAWFSPWPPARSGVAGRSAEIVPILAARGHAIDVFVDTSRDKPADRPDTAPQAGQVRVMSAHDFVWRHAKGHYDLPVYQVGNSHLHRYIWPYLFRFPGLAVVHDARLHHARAEALLSRERIDDYRDEFAWSHPDAPPGAAEFGALEFEGVFYYQWPMLRGVVESARLVAPHSRGVASHIAREWPHRPVQHISLGEGPGAPNVAAARADFRDSHGIARDAVVFGVHGGLTVEKRIVEILKAFAARRPSLPGARLLLVGPDDPWLDLDDQIEALGLTAAVCRVASADDELFDRAIAACDVTFNLRWPSAWETSGPWVRSLAMSRATIVIDSAHQTHVPALDPRTWKRHAPCADLAAGADDRAVTVAIDILDLEHSLGLAIDRLAIDAALRDRLGQAARAWWEQEHTVERMTLDYERAITRALHEPTPSPDWPPHMRPDAFARAKALTAHAAMSDPTALGRLSVFET